MHQKLLFALLFACFVASTVAQKQVAGRMKIVHVYYKNPVSVDIIITTDGNNTAQQFQNVPYKGATDWFHLQLGQYTIEVLAEGITLLKNSFSLTDYSTVAFIEWVTEGPYVLFRIDNIGSISAGKSHITFANYGWQVNNVDVGGSESTLAQNLAYEDFVGPVVVDAGSITANVRYAGDIGEPLITLTGTLEARKHYLFVIVGSNDSNPVLELVSYELTDYSTNARLAIVHGIPGAPLVDVVLEEGVPVYRGISFKGITDYRNIPVGTHTVFVKDSDTGQELVNLSAFFNGFSESTLYAVSGGVTYGDLLADNNKAPASNQARVRVLHGANGADNVDVLADNIPLIESLYLAQASPYLALAAASYPITIKNSITGDTILSTNLTVAAGFVYTVAAIGTAGDSAFTLLVVTDSMHGDNGNLRAVHAISGGPTVNVKVGDTTLFSDVAFGDVSSYMSVESGLYRVMVVNSDNEEIFTSPVRVDAGGHFTAVAGSVEGGVFQLRDDDTRPAATTAHLRVVHASSGSPEVSIEFGGSVVGSLIYTEAFGYAPAPANSYVARVLDKSDDSQVFNGSLTLEADTVVSAFAIGVAGDNFMIVSAIDFDYRAPVASPITDAPVASTPAGTPSKTPTRSSSGSIVTASVALMMLAALV